MIDGHIHIERGDYTLEWIQNFVDRAVEMGLDEIRLLEHNYMFKEFEPMYDSVRAYSDFVDDWFQRKACLKKYEEYLELIDKVRAKDYPVKIKFGLEVCYFKDYEDLIIEQTKDKGFDFLLGSIHFVDDFAFDHKPEHWEGLDVDKIYDSYFRDSVLLAKSKIFDGIGHPDTIKLFGHRPSYSLTDRYEKLAVELVNSNMYADQNSGAERRCPDTASLGMDQELICILKKHNVRIITSSDAHCPEDVGYKIKELEEKLG
ncbi:MAG: histidinol phosphate phosphatase [Eubacterium sp.]|nr:histidinol phosphate phosphatase [Eubacterium sp.]